MPLLRYRVLVAVPSPSSSLTTTVIHPHEAHAILGSSGSVGCSTLSVVESYPDRFQVVTLAVGNNAEAVFKQALRWKARVVSLANEADAEIICRGTLIKCVGRPGISRKRRFFAGEGPFDCAQGRLRATLNQSFPRADHFSLV